MGMTSCTCACALQQSWIELGTVNGKLDGVPGEGELEERRSGTGPSFKKYKLKVPEDVGALVVVTKKYAGQGPTEAVGAGAKDSWTLTDWFENIYIRTAGPAKYQPLFTGKTKFTDPSVKNALSHMLTDHQEQVPPGAFRARSGRVRRRHRPRVRDEAGALRCTWRAASSAGSRRSR